MNNYSRTAIPVKTSAGTSLSVIVKDDQKNQVGSGFAELKGTPEEVLLAIDTEAERLVQLHEQNLKDKEAQAIELAQKEAEQSALLAAISTDIAQPKPVAVKASEEALIEEQIAEISK